MSIGKRLAGLLLLTSSLTFPSLALAQAQDDAGNRDETQDPLLEAVKMAIEGSANRNGPARGLRARLAGNHRGPGETRKERGSRQIQERASTQRVLLNCPFPKQRYRPVTGKDGDIAGAPVARNVSGLSVVGDRSGGSCAVLGNDRYSLALASTGLPLPQP